MSRGLAYVFLVLEHNGNAKLVQNGAFLIIRDVRIHGTHTRALADQQAYRGQAGALGADN